MRAFTAILASVAAWQALAPSAADLVDVRTEVVSLLEAGDAANALRFMESVVAQGIELEDGHHPTLYYYAGVAHQLLGDLEMAVAAYGEALRRDYGDVQTWLNLGDALLYKFQAPKALMALREAVKLSAAESEAKFGSGEGKGGKGKSGKGSGKAGGTVIGGGLGAVGQAPAHVLAKLHRALSWTAAWGEARGVGDELKQRVGRWYAEATNASFSRARPPSPGAGLRRYSSPTESAALFTRGGAPPVMPADFGDLPPAVLLTLTPLLPQADPRTPPGSPPLTHPLGFLGRRALEAKALASSSSSSSLSKEHKRRRRARPLHVGFLSSDFGVHPVSSLIRGLVESLAASIATTGEEATKNERKEKRAKKKKHPAAVEVSCWVLTDEESWWRRNISGSLPDARFVSLHGVPHRSAAERIKTAGVDVLVDLNGHTRGSGLPLLRYRPAPVQVPQSNAMNYVSD